jgi:hypothetical protein
MDEANSLGLAFIPQHLNFAKLKVDDPDAKLLADGVHAEPAIQHGLAVMSFVSRTALAVTYTGVENEFDIMARLGEESVRQWATLSQTGYPVYED